ncbi:MAG: Ig-like domain repeat protein [Terracidiphilus sp.]
MAIESAVKLRRAARSACLSLLLGLLAGGAATAQLPIKAPAPVTVGSIVPFSHGGTGVWNQIYSLKVSPSGSIVFLDSAASVIYQIAPGATAPSTVAGPAGTNGHSDCSDLEPAGTYWNAAVAFDQWNNLYVTDRYGSAVQFCRVPYSASAGTWNFSNADIWAGPTYKNSSGVSSPIPPQDMQVGDDGTFYVTTSDTESIYKFTVNESGVVGTVTAMATGLEDMVSNIAVDHAGNLFFIENAYDSPTNRVTGIREIPAGSATIDGDGTGAAESKLTRIDPAGEGFNGIKGISFDTQGNLYWSSENNTGYGGQVDGVFMTPNEGTPAAPNLVWADTVMISPVAAGFPVLVDPRGLLWIPTGGSGNYNPPGSIAPTCDTTSVKTVAATCLESSIVLWKPGTLNVGASPAGTASTAEPLFYIFSTPTTPAKFSLTGSGSSSFVRSPNPIADPNANPPNPPCTDGTAYPGFSGVETNPAQYSWCALWVAINPSAAGNAGAEVQLLDSSNNIISGSNAYLTGVGQAPAASVVSAAAVQPLATGLNDPLQVTADAAGNTYVADSGLKAIEEYAAGSTSPAAGKAIGTGLSAPTGVAVDRAGDIFIGDSGKVIEIPFINGALAAAQQTTIATGLGNHLNLAADSAGNVYVADKDNKDVVELPNAQTVLLRDGLPAQTIGSGFTGPSAVAADSSGNAWVADGSNLWEITMPFGVASEVLSGLQTPVTGLAVDPSGSVFVAEAGGLSWIPYNTVTGSLNINGQVQVATGLGTGGAALPYGVALDAFQNAYATYGSGSTAGLAQLGVSGSLNFNDSGEINPNVPFEADAQIFNLGNSNLTVQDDPTNDVISGPAAVDYTVGAATENAPACGPSNSTPPGGACYLGLTVTATVAGQDNASISVASNALNATAGLNIAMASTVIQDPRPASSVVMTFTPSSGIVYPGSVSVQVTVSSGAGYGTPTGSVILSVSSTNGLLPKQTQTLDSNGSATFTFTNLLGGTYTVNALYGGDGTGGSTQNSCVPAGSTCYAGSSVKDSFTVAPAAPTFVVGQPGNAGCLKEGTATTDPCTPNQDYITNWAGSTYLNAGQTIWITVTVTSTVGTPSGTVTFMQNGKPADPTQGVNGAIPLTAITLSNNQTVQGAEFSTQNLVQGVYNLTAVYNGDVNFAVESFSLPQFEVIQPSVQITTSGTVSVTPGTPAQATLTLMPLVGFSGDVHLECDSPDAPVQLAPTTPPTVLPAYTQCTFAYADTVTGTSPVGKSGAVASTVVVTISTNVPVNGGTTSSIARQAPWSLAGLFGLGLLGVIAGRRKLNRYMALICVAIMISGLFLGMTACTNAGYSTPPPAPKVTTPAGSYSVQIITYNLNSLQQSSLTTPMFTLPITVN